MISFQISSDIYFLFNFYIKYTYPHDFWKGIQKYQLRIKFAQVFIIFYSNFKLQIVKYCFKYLICDFYWNLYTLKIYYTLDSFNIKEF